jgi:hypothetical protein
MYPVYIDHPHGLDDYTFLPGEKTGDDVVSRKLGLRVKFVCNSHAKISCGDIYEILFDNEEDALAFILRCEYSLIDKSKIKEYWESRKR